jgi:hypothetical protein
LTRICARPGSGAGVESGVVEAVIVEGGSIIEAFVFESSVTKALVPKPVTKLILLAKPLVAPRVPLTKALIAKLALLTEGLTA